MRLPESPDVIGLAATRTLLGVVAEHHEQGRATVRGVRDRVGRSSHDSIWFNLRRLRTLGLVDWEDGRRGTLRPLVRVVGP